jgi:hypothetical protein
MVTGKPHGTLADGGKNATRRGPPLTIGTNN